jgi:hypothetical protein
MVGGFSDRRAAAETTEPTRPDSVTHQSKQKTHSAGPVNSAGKTFANWTPSLVVPKIDTPTIDLVTSVGRSIDALKLEEMRPNRAQSLRERLTRCLSRSLLSNAVGREKTWPCGLCSAFDH